MTAYCNLELRMVLMKCEDVGWGKMKGRRKDKEKVKKRKRERRVIFSE